ncbi:fructosamine kinase family protein [Novosphingobium aquimarinum]|uniref:fructosamine kinase family protein n=1 Tax=Novosphingobium aquimarinum TaxID=2682494 RepID=UPI0012EBE701|nr:fructosamine kinase family protein [Novosphingobium aquimarinum]
MKKLAQRVADLLEEEVGSVSGLGGGDISEVFEVSLVQGARRVVKLGRFVCVEARMLERIAETGVPVPEVLACSDDLMVMTHCAGRSGIGTAWSDLAVALTRLWSLTGTTYGWDEDYAFGSVALPNRRMADWPAFWRDNRLLCHVPHLPADLASRIEAVAARVHDFLPAKPTAGLLHGDLWGGNVLSEGGSVTALIDPACYHGHREVDVAMLTLFDRPPERFFHALDLEPGWEGRLPVYRLFPLLVHYRLFGAGYRAGIESELHKLGF